jgi:phage FluMu protein Com
VLDGNAIAGTLAAAIGADLTVVPGRCAHCGAVTVIGELRAYVRAPGSVLRCPTCDGVVLRVVETADATYIDVRGAAYLRFERR